MIDLDLLTLPGREACRTMPTIVGRGWTRVTNHGTPRRSFSIVYQCFYAVHWSEVAIHGKTRDTKKTF